MKQSKPLRTNAMVLRSLAQGTRIRLPGTGTQYKGANPVYQDIDRPDPYTGAIRTMTVKVAKGIPFVRIGDSDV